ncbi:hypothetical protein [Flavobacterium sp.]|jgi:hypothetical protein|uniref:hypothetical protein n=1 Tax=Flavobacterium sp. TaxID=239 RepID=UPI0037BFD720
MKISLTFLLILFCMTSGFAKDEIIDANIMVQEMLTEITEVQKTFYLKKNAVLNQITTINQQLKIEENLNKKVSLLIQKDALNDNLKKLELENASDISKIRYIKGLQIIKILYEKVLGLDHHFASVRTFSEISKMANPNQYPEFEKIKELVKAKREKKQGVDLTSVLGTNTLVSVINTFSNMMVSGLSKEEKEAELAKIECILDFTLRMQTDLNTIYFETAYLQASNNAIKTDIETLFKDYTKSINYLVSLSECRNNDDWDKVSSQLNTYLTAMDKAEGAQKNKMLINLEFPIDRLIQFITQYNNFINEGEKFYQKFSIILNSYENEKQCESKLPMEYKKLKSDINIAIDKFNVAYRPVEINGTKMREILYGINEFQ